MDLRAAWTVFRFEWTRTLTVPRLAFGAVLALFPVALLALIQYQGGRLEVAYGAPIALFVLIPQVVCLMGLLLWATPVIHSELEGRTWTYLAIRPAGKGAILAGKYLTATTWTTLVALVSLTACMPVIWPDTEPLRVFAVVAALTVLASLAYGALYVLMGVIFLRRAMVAAVAYTVMSEFVVSWVPATIHHFTMQYHLRCLGAEWLGWPDDLPHDFPIDRELLFGSLSTELHLLILLSLTAALFTAAVFVLRHRELVRADEA
jgi:ABC-type transport system involved in multi-copper enzyme maturation permease subunit